MAPTRVQQRNPPPHAPREVGVVLAVSLLLTWAVSLATLLRAPLGRDAAWWFLPALLGMTLLYTGLFITAHDAMHGSVAPGRPRLNAALGRVAMLAFALLPYEAMRVAHHEHHRHPASAEDPDFHDGARPGFGRWYLRFLLRYARPLQVISLAAVFNVLHHLLGVPQVNLFAFWMAPPLLASAQLFYFGTYLPHREPKGGYVDAHRAESSRQAPFVSLVACYHFGGYHYEHHLFPGVPWWRLPKTREEQVERA